MSKHKKRFANEDNVDLHQGNPNSIFYENRNQPSLQNAISSISKQNTKWDKEESDDDFDKLIGHIEGSRIEPLRNNNEDNSKDEEEYF